MSTDPRRISVDDDDQLLSRRQNQQQTRRDIIDGPEPAPERRQQRLNPDDDGLAPVDPDEDDLLPEDFPVGR